MSSIGAYILKEGSKFFSFAACINYRFHNLLLACRLVQILLCVMLLYTRELCLFFGCTLCKRATRKINLLIINKLAQLSRPKLFSTNFRAVSGEARNKLALILNTLAFLTGANPSQSSNVVHHRQKHSSDLCRHARHIDPPIRCH